MAKKIKDLKPTQEQLDTLATIMDDEIREELHGYYDDPGEFLVAYIKRDPKFGELNVSDFLPVYDD